MQVTGVNRETWCWSRSGVGSDAPPAQLRATIIYIYICIYTPKAWLRCCAQMAARPCVSVPQILRGSCGHRTCPVGLAASVGSEGWLVAAAVAACESVCMDPSTLWLWFRAFTLKASVPEGLAFTLPVPVNGLW